MIMSIEDAVDLDISGGGGKGPANDTNNENAPEPDVEGPSLLGTLPTTYLTNQVAGIWISKLLFADLVR